MLYWLGRGIFLVMYVTLFRMRVEGLENVPREGGVLLVANHASYLDPPLVGAAMKRKVHFMAKAELFQMFFLKWALPRVAVFPVKRGTADRESLRRAVGLLKGGHIVCLFPEGTRSKTGELLPPQRGAALIAMQAEVPIVPIGLVGTFKPVRKKPPFFNRFVVRVGKPIEAEQWQQRLPGVEPNRRATLTRLNEMMMEAIAALVNG